MERNNNEKVKSIAVVGMMAAMVFALSAIRIYLPFADGKAAIHFGNIFCILSGLLFGPLSGGLAAGIGSMLYDFTNPLYIMESPITFINKFAMGFIAGLLFKKLRIANLCVRGVISAACGQGTYIILYLSKNFIYDKFLYQHAPETIIANLIAKGTTSSIVGVVSVICSVILLAGIRKVLVRTPFRNQLV